MAGKGQAGGSFSMTKSFSIVGKHGMMSRDICRSHFRSEDTMAATVDSDGSARESVMDCGGLKVRVVWEVG